MISIEGGEYFATRDRGPRRGWARRRRGAAAGGLTPAPAPTPRPPGSVTGAHDMQGTSQATSSSDAAAAIASLARAGGRLAIDTEFVSERRYQAQLCLVQAAAPATDGGVRTEVIDPLDRAIGSTPAPLAAALADPAIEVVVHAGRQDVAILRRTWDTESPTSSTPRSPPGSSGSATRRATSRSCAGCWACACAAARASRAGTSAR